MPSIFYENIEEYTRLVERTCSDCGARYRICDYETNADYFAPPYRYLDGCEDCCLKCWLVGPDEVAEEFDVSPPLEDEDVLPVAFFEASDEDDSWNFNEHYPSLADGRLLEGYSWFLERGWSLVVMPWARLKIAKSVFFPNGVGLYRAGLCELGLAEGQISVDECTAASSVSLELYRNEPIVTLPCRLDCTRLGALPHSVGLEVIRNISAWLSLKVQSYLCFRFGNLENLSSIPCRPGQVSGGSTTALLFNSGAQTQPRLLGGSVFPSVVTQGLGLAVRQPEWDEMPTNGEVGRIVHHALRLYMNTMETPCQTSKFVQVMSLFEYLAFPHEYKNLSKVRPIIAKYCARSAEHESELTDRFKTAFFGKGYRYLIVHLGKRLEEILPSPRDRRLLFRELDSYIRPIVDHMTLHSEMTWTEYVGLRDGTLPKFKSDELGPDA